MIKMRNNKKGAEMTIQLIVIAVIVLIVMIVLVVIFSQRTGKFVGGVASCTTKGGYCASSVGTCDSEARAGLGLGVKDGVAKEIIWSTLPDTNCDKPPKTGICCIPTVTS